jgi:hypothetical protein
MKKVFVLSNGSYSDFRVVAVYSTRKGAELAANIFTDEPSIEEYDLDTGLAYMKAGRRSFFVRLNRETGDTMEVYPNSSSYGAFSTDVGVDINQNLYTYAWGKDSAHAVKIASERRRTFLARPTKK